MNRVLVLVIISTLFFIGCATKQKPMYTWGKYSKSLYNYKKNPGEKSLAKHIEVLDKIMQDSKDKELRVPPGVCVEYGYILMNEGKTEEAINYFRIEEETYPESTVLIERLINNINGKKVEE